MYCNTHMTTTTNTWHTATWFVFPLINYNADKATIHRRFNSDLSAAQHPSRHWGQEKASKQTKHFHTLLIMTWSMCEMCLHDYRGTYQHQPQLEKPSSQTAFRFPARPSSLDNNDPALCQPRRIHDNIYHFLLSSSYLFPSGSSKLLTLAPVLTVCAALTDWIWGTSID